MNTREKLEMLQAGLGLDGQEIAKMLGLHPAWVLERGDSALSDEAKGLIETQLFLLAELESYVRAEVRQSFLRYPNEGLGGKRPLDLLLEGRGEEIVAYLRESNRARGGRK